MAKPGIGRLAAALAAYAVLAALTWFFISEPKVRAIPLVLLAFFAMKTLVWHVRMRHELGELREEQE